MMTARRLTILAFYLQADGTVRRMALTRPNVGLDDHYEQVWINQKGSTWAAPLGAPGEPETQMECLARIIRECAPKAIGLNFSKYFAFSDGLSHTLYEMIFEALDEADKAKVVSAENLCVGWMEARLPEEIAAYTGIVQIAHSMIAEAFSSRVITPGVTTNADVKYFMLQRCVDLGLTPWFDYEVSVKRKGVGSIESDNVVIMPGDILHCDVGITYLGLCTDTQENAYILEIGEQDAPDYLKAALKDVNDFQDMVVESYKEGLTGNDILRISLEKGFAAGLKPCLYTHPIGYHGHGAGPTIGLYDKQGGVEGNGDYPLYEDTCYSLELNCTVNLPEYNGDIRLGAETDIIFTGGKAYYAAGRQDNWHLVK